MKIILKTTIASAAMLFLNACPCLTSVSIKPQAASVDFTKGTVATIGVETMWNFSDCCVKDEQQKIALDMQTAIAEDFGKLRKREITIEKYNDEVKAANDALQKVVFVCRAMNSGTPAVAKPTGMMATAKVLGLPHQKGYVYTQKDYDLAWKNAGVVLNKIQTKKPQ